MRILLSLVAVFSLFLSCTKEQSVNIDQTPVVMEKTYPLADERLWSYFEAFEEEAARRGLDFDLRALNILGLIENIDENGVAGQCKYGSHINNEVTLDNAFWQRANDRQREFVVFHELGHCVLLRDHRESQNADGTCQSLMRSGIQDCRDNYSSATRAGYLDELFSINNS